MTNIIYNPEIEGNEFLYKYMKFDDNFVKTLVNNELWFSNPLEGFNDPYDFQLGIETDATKEELLSYLQHRNDVFSDKLRKESTQKAIQLMKERGVLEKDLGIRLLDVKNGQDFDSPEIIKERLRLYIKNPEQLKKDMNDNLLKIAKNFRVLCLTKEENNILMWAHYSENHKGVRIKLSITKNDEFYKTPIVVQYPPKYPIFNYIKEIDNLGNGKLMNHIAGFKSKEWKYENEIRIVKDIYSDDFRNDGLKKFRKEIVEEIAFGINAAPSDIELTKNIIENYYENKVIIKKAEKIDNSFSLNLNPVY